MPIHSAKIIISCLVIAVTLSVSDIPAPAAAPDIGLVTGLSGEVTYGNQAEKQSPVRAQAFLKIRQGDRFQVPEGAGVQLLYFAGGRQETWKGPVTLQIGEAESQSAGEQPPRFPPEVKVLSSKVAKGISGSPVMISRTETSASGASQVMRETGRSSGVIQTMAPTKAPSLPPGPVSSQAQKEVAAAEQLFPNLKKQAKAGDLTPEIYLLSVYAAHRQYQKMEQIIDTMLAKNLGDRHLRELKSWARSQGSDRRECTPLK
jgi:hypothetical protein